MRRIENRALIFPEGAAWIVQALDRDICAQGTTVMNAVRSFERTVAAEIAIRNYEAIPAPPKEFHNVEAWPVDIRPDAKLIIQGGVEIALNTNYRLASGSPMSYRTVRQIGERYRRCWLNCEEIMIETVEQNGIIMSLGASPRPRDPGEDKYSIARTVAPATVNLNEPVSLLKYSPPILNQGGLGSCAMFTVAECDFITRNAARDRAKQSINAELAHPGFLYEKARRLRGWFPRDSGSWPADGFDMLLVDKPLLSRTPYTDNAAFDYDDNLFANSTPIDDLASHRPFYVNDGDALQRIKQCLDLGWAVAICMYWHPSYYNPPNGILPEGQSWSPDMGAHALTLRARTPDRGGLLVGINHWTDRWNLIVTNLGFDFRPGELAIPDSFFLPNRNSPVFELRAASPEAIQSSPEPEPDARPEIDGLPKRKGHKPKYIIWTKNADPDAQLFIDSVVTDVGLDGERFVLRRELEPGKHTATIQNSNGKMSPPVEFAVTE